jgi:hypothetical protein
MYMLLRTSGNKTKPIQVKMLVHNEELQMEVDTGASCSVISEETYNILWSNNAPKLNTTDVKLRTYTGETVKILPGSITVDIEYHEQQEKLNLLVVAGAGPTLLGRDWLHKIRLDWKGMLNKMYTSPANLQEILDKHKAIFSEELGLITGMTAKIHIDNQAEPKFCRPRTTPYALTEKVNQEIDRLERSGIIKPVEFSDWASPIVSVVKPDGSMRLCGDYKVTINRVTKVDKHPIPRIRDILSTLSGGKSFTKLDLAHAYQQVPLDEESQKLTTINTPKGLYQYTRLPFGISSAPAIFQRVMETLLQGIPNVSVYIDDILVTGRTQEEHLQNLQDVLSRLERAGLRLKRPKCAFMLPSFDYLGYQISAEGIQPQQRRR